MQVSSWNEALASGEVGDAADVEDYFATQIETRDRQKAQKLTKMEKAGTLPSSVKEALDAAAKNEKT